MVKQKRLNLADENQLKRKYLKNIFRISKETVKRDFDIKGNSVKLGVQIIGTVIILAVAILAGVLRLAKVEEIIFSILGAEILLHVILLISIPFIAILKMPLTASLLDLDQSELLASYQEEKLKLKISHLGFKCWNDGKIIDRVVACEVSNLDQYKIIDLDVKLIKADHYKTPEAEPTKWMEEYKAWNILWSKETKNIDLAPEDKAMVHVAMTDKFLCGMIINIPPLGEGTLPNGVWCLQLRFKGKLEGENKYRFLIHNAIIYSNYSAKNNDHRLQFLELLKGQNIDIRYGFWSFLDNKDLNK